MIGDKKPRTNAGDFVERPQKAGNPGGTGAAQAPGPDGYRGHHRPGRNLRCGAHARSTGKPCRRFAIAERNRCRLHGGKTPRGILAANWKHGYYSQALPADVAALARRASADPELRGMKTQIAITDARVHELCANLKTGGGAWGLALAAMGRLERAGDDLNAARTALIDLKAAIEGGRNRERAWAEIRELFQERDRLLTGEVNRHKATADTINADRVAAFMVGMIDALREESQDRDLIRRVLNRWERLMGLAGVATPARPKGADA